MRQSIGPRAPRRPAACGGGRFFPLRRTRRPGEAKRNKGRQDYTVLTDERPGPPVAAPLVFARGRHDHAVGRLGGRRRRRPSAWGCGRWPAGSTATARTSTRRPPTWPARPRCKSAARRFACWSRRKASGSCRRRSRDDCRSIGRRRTAEPSRGGRALYFGSDGVMVPQVTEAEKDGAAGEDQGEASAPRQEGPALAGAEGAARTRSTRSSRSSPFTTRRRRTAW